MKNNVYIEKISVNNFKSIKGAEVKLKNTNVLIGCNGAGKSNVLSAFHYIQNLLKDKNTVINYNNEKTERAKIEFEFNKKFFNGNYKLSCRENDSLFVECQDKINCEKLLKSIKFETFFIPNSPLKVHFNEIKEKKIRLKADTANFAEYIYYIKENMPAKYEYYINTVKMIAAYFEDFIFQEDKGGKLMLWKDSNKTLPLEISALSNGTLRFARLAALFLQDRVKNGELIIIDEPELGLHPFAVTILAELIKAFAVSVQVIIATQSSELLDAFEVEDVIVVDRAEEGSKFSRLNREKLKNWLADNTLSELWKKNYLNGR